MKNIYQKGSAAIIALVAVIVLIVVIALAFGFSYVGAINYGASVEAQLKATKENNENILAQYGQKLTESVQVPEMARDDLVKTLQAAIQGRYGADGAKAAVLMVKEQNLGTDPQLYRKIQQLIEAGRDEFKQSQTKMVDVKRNYETSLNQFPRGTFLRMAGYPKLDLAEFKIVTTDYASEAFRTGKEKGPIQLRAKVPPME